jgi:hypothetical protein
MSQLGHASAALALEVYAKVQQRQRDTGARMDALIRPPDWALRGLMMSTRWRPFVSLTTKATRTKRR